MGVRQQVLQLQISLAGRRLLRDARHLPDTQRHFMRHPISEGQPQGYGDETADDQNHSGVGRHGLRFVRKVLRNSR